MSKSDILIRELQHYEPDQTVLAKNQINQTVIVCSWFFSLPRPSRLGPFPVLSPTLNPLSPIFALKRWPRYPRDRNDFAKGGESGTEFALQRYFFPIGRNRRRDLARELRRPKSCVDFSGNRLKQLSEGTRLGSSSSYSPIVRHCFSPLPFGSLLFCYTFQFCYVF